MRTFVRYVVVALVFLAAGWAFALALQTHSVRATEAAPAQRTGAQRLSIYEFLVPFAPDRADEIAALIEEQGHALEDEIDPSSIPPWSQVMTKLEEALIAPESVDKRMRERTGWFHGQLTSEVDFRTHEYNPRGVEIGDADLAALRELAGGFDRELLQLEEEESVALTEALRAQWRKDEFVKIPLVLLPVRPQPGRRLLVSRALTIQPWNVSVGLFAGDAPAYEEAAGRVDQRRSARLRAVRDAITKLADAR